MFPVSMTLRRIISAFMMTRRGYLLNTRWMSQSRLSSSRVKVGSPHLAREEYSNDQNLQRSLYCQRAIRLSRSY